MLKKIILGIVCVSTLFCTACAPTNSSSDSGESDKFVSEVLLNSFENYYDCYDFYYSGDYVIDFEKTENTVTDGTYAMKLTPDSSNAGKTTSMTFGVPLYELGSDENNYRDFSKMSRITFDVYNDSDNEVLVSTSIMQKKIGYMYSNMQGAVVAAKSKATVTYSVNRYEIFYALGITGPTHVNVGVSGLDPLVYVDNMRLHYTQDEFVEPEAVIQKDEIIKFEKAYQAFVTYTTGTVLKAEVLADVSNASEGNCYVRIRRDGVEDGVAVYGGRFGISANYLGNIKFDSYPATSYIAFDYKSGWSSANAWVVPRLVSSSSGGYANIHGANFVCDEKWHTFYIPLAFAPAFLDNIEISFDGGTKGEFYLDNFRMEMELPENTKAIYVAQKYGKT